MALLKLNDVLLQETLAALTKQLIQNQCQPTEKVALLQKVLVGSLVIFAAAGLFAWALQSKHQKYEALSQSDLTEEISSRNRSQRSSSDA